MNEEHTAHALIFVSAEEAQHWPRGSCVLKRRVFVDGNGNTQQRYEADNYFREDWVMDEARRFGNWLYALLPNVPGGSDYSQQLAKLGERLILATQRYVITLSDEDFHKLKKRKNHLKATLIGRHGDIELIIQREAK